MTLRGTGRSHERAALPPDGAYAKSKRADVVYTLEPARRTAGIPVEAIVIHPGAAMTGLQQHRTGGLPWVLTPSSAACDGIARRRLLALALRGDQLLPGGPTYKT